MGRKKKEISSDIDSSRCRNWTCVAYPESLPERWRDILDEMHIEWIESPLHDKDVNPTGEPKKAHYHLVFLFGGVKSFDQVKTITDSLNAPIPQRVHNVKSAVRYMAHLDNPDKHQYPRNAIIPHGGVNLDSVFLPSATEEQTYLKQIFAEIKANNIYEFSDLIFYVLMNGDDDLLLVITRRHSLISSFITSYRNKYHPSKQEEV